jgi:hypothetical protein
MAVESGAKHPKFERLLVCGPSYLKREMISASFFCEQNLLVTMSLAFIFQNWITL